jgi:hypothetical protein
MILHTGMPSPDQMPQQQMVMPPPSPRDMTIDLLGVKIPAELLSSGAFWAFLAVSVVTALVISYWKYKARAQG